MSQIRRTLLSAKNKKKIDVNNYLTIVALEDDLTALISTDGAEYCIDGSGDWKTLAADEKTPSINSGQTLSFKKILEPNTATPVGTFAISKKCKLIGNCMSMIFGDEGYLNFDLTMYNSCFLNMFQSLNSYINYITEVSDDFLPATTLSERCYYAMFSRSPLTKGPKLPAKKLTNRCYAFMYNFCSSFKESPELPATILSDFCYQYFLRGTAITVAPELPAENLAQGCYDNMLNTCANLKIAPILPAKILVSSCYKQMFTSCSNLNYIKMLATDVSASNCLSYWVSGVSSTGTFVKSKDATWDITGVSGIPSGWTVETK